MRLRVAGVVVLMMFLLACGHPTGPDDPNIVRVDGTVRFVTLEGGFWAVYGDDNVTYDPMNGLPAPFQIEGLRVRMEARRRPDIGGIHMVGPIVEIIAIDKL